MRQKQPLLATLAFYAAAVVGMGTLYAQPDKPKPAPAPANDKLPDVTVNGSKSANLSPKEMSDQASKLVAEMEGYHVRVLALQAAARKAKDVIKLNCVNESLLAVKQLLNIADAAQNELVGAIAGDDHDAEVHQYSQVTLAHERAASERDAAEACIGDEIVFVGPTKVSVTGPAMPDDPTQDPQNPFSLPPGLEHPNDASPWY